MAAAWPTVAEVKQVLGISTDARDAVITAAVGAAVEQVAVDIGYVSVDVSEAAGVYTLEAVTPAAASEAAEADEEPTPEEVTPSWSLSQAALILSVQTLKAPEAPYGIAAVFDTGGLRVAAEHPTYQQMLLGERLAFGVG
jgi:hypothetical protein